VSEPSELARAYDEAEKLGPVDCIVHSAVLYLLGSAIDAKLEDLDKAWAVGPRAFLAAARAVFGSADQLQHVEWNWTEAIHPVRKPFCPSAFPQNPRPLSSLM
jgi:hypothetical protein